MECPDPKCREDLLTRINTKVSRTVLLSVALGIITVSGGFITYGMGATAKTKDKVSQNSKDVAVVKRDIEHIKESVKRIEQNQLTKPELIDAIKKAMGK